MASPNTGSSEFWDGVYENKGEHVSWFQAKPQLSLDLITRSGIQKTDPILDVGSGTSTLVDWLLREGYRDITILDISAAALRLTRDRLEKSKYQADLQFEAADITTFDFKARSFSLWHDRAVFHFLSEPLDRALYVANLRKALQPGGFLVIGTFAIDGVQQCSGMDITHYDSQKMQAELGASFQLIEEHTEIHLTPWHSEQPFWYGLFRFLPTSDSSELPIQN